jgi:ankyrin repeat protein
MRGISLVERECLANIQVTLAEAFRSVLHLASSSNTPVGYTFFSILLRNTHISVNLQDFESGYTALHRALFSGNVKAARDLLARSDTDASIKDAEGMTAFDLYNGTVDGVRQGL